MLESFYPHRNYFLICAMLCVLGKYVYAGEIGMSFQSLESMETLSTSDGNETVINRGDPGWVRKMALRHVQRMRAGKDKTALASLKVDHFNLPVLLGSYKDMSGSLTVQDFQNHLFSNTSGSTMTDYFNEVSYGQFHIAGDVYGWYQTDKPVADYLPSNYASFCLDIVQKADPDIDFSPYDNDGPDGLPNSGDDDGYVDAVLIFYPGLDDEMNLPTLQGNLGAKEYSTQDVSYRGGKLKIRTFVLVAEQWQQGETKSISALSVICHEFLHVLGLPDLYDYTGFSMGLGHWCLMAEGIYLSATSPPHISAWCKVQLGWVLPRVITQEENLSIGPIESEQDIYLLWEDGYQFSSYFLLENRQKIGYDNQLPGSGLLIYHVDENQRFGRELFGHGSVNNNLHHKLVDLEEADGKADLDRKRNYADAGDPFPGSTGNTVFDTNSSPNSREYSNFPTGVAVTSIVSDGLNVSARLIPREKIGYVLSYDPNGLTGKGWTPDKAGEEVWGGVLFKASGAGLLAAIDLGLMYDVSEFKIKIFSTLSDSITSDMIYTYDGGATSAGWHTVNLQHENIWIKKEQEFFVVYRTDSWITVDTHSDYTGRSYFSADGIYFSKLPSQEFGNFNIRARIRTVNPVLCDFNADGAVDSGDVISLLTLLRNNPGDPAADFNRDGRANILDAFSMLIAQRGGRCEDQADQ